MKTEQQYREELAHFGRLLYERGLVVANDGNLSIRLDDQSILASPTGVCKGTMQPEDMVVVDLAGKHIRGGRTVTSEIGMHMAIYGKRPDINAVVHAHPVTATAFACAGRALDQPLVAEMVTAVGEVPLTPYGTPGTSQIAACISDFIREHDALLLANHGAVTCGATVQDAFFKMETVEHIAKITLITSLLGQQNCLADTRVSELREIAARHKQEALLAVLGA